MALFSLPIVSHFWQLCGLAIKYFDVNQSLYIIHADQHIWSVISISVLLFYYYHPTHLKRCPATLILTSASVPDSHQYSFIQQEISTLVRIEWFTDFCLCRRVAPRGGGASPGTSRSPAAAVGQRRPHCQHTRCSPCSGHEGSSMGTSVMNRNTWYNASV